MILYAVRIALCQILVIDGDREGNFRRIEYALQAARSERAVIAAFPESAVLGWENPDAHRLATPIPGADSDRIAALARRYGLMIAIGLDEKDGSRLYDSAILVDKTGKLLWKHRKINVLAELMTPPYSEGKPEDIGLVDTEYGRVGVLICADTFIDALVARLEKNLEKLISQRARVLECPIVGVDLVGVMSQGPWKGRTYGGASIVADATGKILHVLRDRDVEVRVVDVEVRKSSNLP